MERKILLIDKDEFYINFVQERLQKEQYKIINEVTTNIAMRCNLGIMGQTVEFVIRHK